MAKQCTNKNISLFGILFQASFIGKDRALFVEPILGVTVLIVIQKLANTLLVFLAT